MSNFVMQLHMTVALKYIYSEAVYSGVHTLFIKSSQYFSVWSSTNLFREVKLSSGLNVPFLGAPTYGAAPELFEIENFLPQ